MFIFSSSAVKLDGVDATTVSLESGLGTLTVSDASTSGGSGACVSSAEVVEVSSGTVSDGKTPVMDEGTTDIVEDTSSNVAVAVPGSLDGSSLSILASAPLVPVSLSDSCEYINSCHVTFLIDTLF